MLRPLLHTVLPMFALALLGAGPAAAQPAARPAAGPFTSLEVSVGGALDVHRTDFHDLWEPSPGGAATVGMPFYRGRIHAGGAVHRYTAVGDVPAFTSVLVHLGWGLEARPAPWLRGYAGVELGNYAMRFEDFETPPDVDFARWESELALGATARVDVHPTPAWSLFARATLQRVYTRLRIDQAVVAAGVSRTFATPRWLQRVLR